MADSERICPKCRARVGANAKFCPNGCGALPVVDSSDSQGLPKPGDTAKALVVECARPEAGWYCLSAGKGNRASIRFRLSVSKDVYSEVSSIVVNISGKNVLKESSPSCGRWLVANWIPELPGEETLTVEVSCKRHDGGVDEYEIDPVQLLVDTLLDNGTVKINVGDQNINATSDRAGDSNVVINPVFNINRSVAFDPNSQRYITDVKRFAPLEMKLVCFGEPPAPPPPPPPSAPRITLRRGDEVIQVTSLRSMVFGKMRERTDYALRVYDSRREYDRDASSWISRVHFRIAFDGERCTVTDEKSTNGTFLDGARLPWGAPAELAPGVTHAIVLCDKHRKPLLTLDVCVTGSPGGVPSGIKIGRSDGARQTIFAVWGAAGVPFGGGLSLLDEDGRFVLRADGGQAKYLVPGQEVSIGEGSVSVERFNQPFSHEH